MAFGNHFTILNLGSLPPQSKKHRHGYNLYFTKLYPITHPRSWDSKTFQIVAIAMSSLNYCDANINLGSAIKNLPANAGDMSLIHELGRSPGEGNGNPLLHSCLENSRDRGAWWATVCGVAKGSDTT